MIDYDVVLFDDSQDKAWDDFVDSSCQGTFIHSRRYLAYHGDRYEDMSLLIMRDEQLVGLFIAARDPSAKSRLISHPGTTFGGLIVADKVYGMETVSVLLRILEKYQSLGIDEIMWRCVPHVFHRRVFEDESFALFCGRARLTRFDLIAAIDLKSRGRISQRRIRGFKKAKGSSIVAHVNDWSFIECLWRVLGENLRIKHKTTPTHQLNEINRLKVLFPEEINCSVACLRDEVVAGVVSYKFSNVFHCQYICASGLGHQVGALDFLIEEMIKSASQCGNIRWFSFGSSRTESAYFMNQSLYEFKHQFGSSGIGQRTYQVKVDESVKVLREQVN